MENRKLKIKKENVLKTKNYALGKACLELQANREFILSKQLLRSATSAGANKEANKTHYWIRVVMDSQKIERIKEIND